jgi:hypothetical protein
MAEGHVCGQHTTLEIKEGKNAQKVIKHNLSLLIRGGYQWPKA